MEIGLLLNTQLFERTMEKLYFRKMHFLSWWGIHILLLQGCHFHLGVSGIHTHMYSYLYYAFFLVGKKIKLGSAKRRRGWNQIWGLLAITFCLIASLNRMSAGTCPDRFRQLVKTHDSSAAQKALLPSSVCSLKAVLSHVCYFHREDMQRKGQEACVSLQYLPFMWLLVRKLTSTVSAGIWVSIGCARCRLAGEGACPSH